MPDVYAAITEAAPELVQQLAGVMELRAADPQQRAMRDVYLEDVGIGDGTRVLEVGCGSGAVARAIAERFPKAEVVGADPSPVLIEYALSLGSGRPNLTFDQADARSLSYNDGSFDTVIYHTVLCHVPGPEAALAQAYRVLRPGGSLAVFDGDYATTTVAGGDADPLQACVLAAVDSLVHDPWLVRRLPSLVRAAGFEISGTRAFSLVESDQPGYMLTMIDRGADALVRAGRIGDDLARACKIEARRRVDAKQFFGHVAYLAVVGRKP